MDVQPATRTDRSTRYLFFILILLAVAAASYFRFWNLRQYPGWYSDEGNHIDLAENWINGDWRNYGVLGAPFSQRPPLYMYTISAAMSLLGVDITESRGVSAAASLLTMGLAAWTAWKALGRKEGILTLWLAAVAPWIIVFSRLGLTYNLMGLFFLFSLLALWYYLKKTSTGWLVASAVSSALAFSTDYLGVLCGVTIGLAVLISRPRDILKFIGICLATLVLTFLPVLRVNPGIFFMDMRNLFSWGGGVQSTSNPLISILINYTELLRRESWILLGICGLFLIKDTPLRNIFLASVGLTLLMVTRAYTPVGVGLHYLMHLFPIFALGLSVFLIRAYEIVKNFFFGQGVALFLHSSPLQKDNSKKSNHSQYMKISSYVSVLLAAVIVFTPLVWMFLSSFAMVTYQTDYIFTGNDDLRLVDANAADRIRMFLSENAEPEDLVIGSPVLIWGLPTMNRADFLAALAYNDYKPTNYIDVEKNRYAHPLELDKAAYVILDPLAEEFAPLVLPGMSVWLDEIHSWPVVFEADDIRVYQH